MLVNLSKVKRETTSEKQLKEMEENVEMPTKSKQHRRTTNVEFTEEQCHKLIGKVEKYACLWDITSPSYKNRNLIQIAWEKVSAAIGVGKDDVIAKWTLLRQQFRNAFNKAKRTKIGMGAATRKPPNAFYEAMMFMAPTITKSKARARDKHITKKKKGSLKPSDLHRTSLLTKASEISDSIQAETTDDLWGRLIANTLKTWPNEGGRRRFRLAIMEALTKLENGDYDDANSFNTK